MAEIEKTRKQIRLEKETFEKEKYNELKKKQKVGQEQENKQEETTGVNPLFDNQFVVTHFTSLFVQFLYENGFTPQEVEAMFGVYVGTDTNKKTEKFDRAFVLQQQQSGNKKNQVTSVLLNKIKQLEDRLVALGG